MFWRSSCHIYVILGKLAKKSPCLFLRHLQPSCDIYTCQVGNTVQLGKVFASIATVCTGSVTITSRLGRKSKSTAPQPRSEKRKSFKAGILDGSEDTKLNGHDLPTGIIMGDGRGG